MAEVQDLLRNMQTVLDYAEANADSFSSQEMVDILEALHSASSFLDQKKAQASFQPVPDAARLLWIASGSQPSVFAKYIQQYPDPSLDLLRQNPNLLSNALEQLEEEFPKEQKPTAGGIKESWVPSSNIWGFQYDPQTSSLLVKFNGKDNKADGPIYRYFGVPAEIYEIFRKGAIPAKTTGSNKWGQWWQQKMPSLGASHAALIKKGGYGYQRLR